MATALIAVFLIVHGLLHLAVWLPPPDPEKAPPFDPGRSRVLTVSHVSALAARRTAAGLAVTACALYIVAGAAVVFGSEWTPGIAVAAAVAGLVLKVLYFNPWLLVGIGLDAIVLLAALAEWPFALS
jgi:hypothetical protein